MEKRIKTEKLVKITYLTGDKGNICVMAWKDNVKNMVDLNNYVAERFFDKLRLPRCEYKLFYEDDKDEILLQDSEDLFYMFVAYSCGWHIKVAPIVKATEKCVTDGQCSKSSSASNETKIPPAAGSYENAVHAKVECDVCLMAPIVGFRYKCIQCEDYDLCENCEAKHYHSEHMMVRMPNNNCPGVIESYVTRRSSTGHRRHRRQRSKTSCPFEKYGLSVVIDDDNDDNDEEQKTATGKDAPEQSASSKKNKERHHDRKHQSRHRYNFFSNLYEMMNDLAEGGVVAAAHAMGESPETSDPPSTSNKKQQTPTTTTTGAAGETEYQEEKQQNNTTTDGKAQEAAAQKAHAVAAKVAEIAAKVAHESALNAAKVITENMTYSTPLSSSYASSSNFSTSNATSEQKENKTNNDNVDATTSERENEQSQRNSIPVMPAPPFPMPFLDPQFMRNGVQILNNFSDMFAKMLDPMESYERRNSQNYESVTKTGRTSSVASNSNSMGSSKNSEEERSMEKEPESVKQTENKQKSTDSSPTGFVELNDLGSDESENESISGSYVKLDNPKDKNDAPGPSFIATEAAASAHNSPGQSLNNSNNSNFSKLGEDLKSFLAQEALNESMTEPLLKEKTVTDNSMNSREPVAPTNNAVSTLNRSPANGNEEKRAVPVYHPDERINNSVNVMMAMGFSNEGAWLTQLLESVNGNIPEALDLMSAAQRNGNQ